MKSLLTLGLVLAAAAAGAQNAPATAPAVPAAQPVFNDSLAQTPPAGPTSPVSIPGMAGPLTINPNPLAFKSKLLGTVYVSGVASSLFQVQTNAVSGDKTFRSDISNGQIFIQKNAGVVQFFVQVGGYAVPALGVASIRSGLATDDFFGVFPQGYLKIAPTRNFSVQVGKLPTLMGAEYTFSFENMNIQRGLLWNQENAVNRGVQLNYTAGPVVFAVAYNDGQYSKKYNWLSGAATIALNSTNSLALIATGSLSRTDIATSATPLYQNNEQLYNLIYTRTAGPWTFQPYLQYTYVPASPVIGTTQKGTTAAAAVLASYAVPNSGLRLPFRLEYLASTGEAEQGAPNLLYGAGSNAFSITATPTYQYERFFGRTELSFVQATHTAEGAAFGAAGNSASQSRALLEVGVLF